MDFSQLDPDFFARAGAYTKTIHRDLYPSIDPASPALSQHGKVVVITGSSSGIGARGLVPAFARAGARGLVLVGRRQDKLAETAATIRQAHPSVEVLEVAISISDPKAVQSLFESVEKKFGHADILVNNAGVLGQSGQLSSSDADVWWGDFETNVRGTYLVTKEFLSQLGSDRRGTVISVSSGAATVVLPGMSSYGISKLAVNRLTEYTALEHPNVISITLDPGTVNTDMVTEAFSKFAHDTPELVGGAAVWLTSAQAEFMNGRVMMANWSVDDMLARKDAILKNDDLKLALRGKFGPDA